MDPASTGARQTTKFLAIWLIETVKIQLFLDHLQVSWAHGRRGRDVPMAFPRCFFLLGQMWRQELSWCFDFSATEVPKDCALSNTALLEQDWRWWNHFSSRAGPVFAFWSWGMQESLNPPFSLVPEYGEDLPSLQEGENTKPLKICDGSSPLCLWQDCDSALPFYSSPAGS